MTYAKDKQWIEWNQAAKLIKLAGFELADPRSFEMDDATPRETIEADCNAIDTCHGILVLGDSPSWGAAQELFYAWSKEKICAVKCNADPRSRWMEGHAHCVENTLIAAIQFLKDTIK